MRAKDLFEKSTSQAQFRTMAAAANNPKFAKKVGISQDVAREFHAADRKSDYKKLPDHANESQLNELFDADQQYFKLADGQVIRADFTQAGLNPDGMSSSIKISTVDPKIMPSAATTAVQPWDKARPNIRAAIQKWVQGGQQDVSEAAIAEDLRKWFKEKWVRFGPDGKIRGDCARGSSSEGKPKCLPQSKAQSLGKKGRASAAAKKRREDPDPERRGAAKNVATKVKEQDITEKWSKKYKSSINCSHPKGFSQKAHCAGKKKHNEDITMEMTCPDCNMCETHGDHSHANLDEACWKGYHKEGNKELFGKTVPNCVKNEAVEESHEMCPECGGNMYPDTMINEKKDACYYKVKSRYKVWPSAYASGALVKCRKKGAKNWGNKNEAANPAQQAAIAIAMKKAGQKPKSQGVAEGESRGGIDLEVTELPDENQILITATSHGKTLGRVYFDIFDSQLVAADAEVASEYHGQGIAAIIYDYAKELGWEVVRSGRQTDAGAGFWDKHRPKQDVWEQGVAEGFSWSSLDSGMSMEDKMSVFEEFHTKGNLTESVDDNKRAYFVSLFNMSAPLTKGKKYIVVPLSLVGNRILPLDAPSIAELVAQSNDGLTFNTSNGEKTYPSKTMRNLSIFNTFTFSSTSVYDKFRTALSLKFDISLPSVSKSGQQGMAEGSLNEFAPGAGGGDAGNYFQTLASAWYNGAFDSGSLQKGIKSKEDVERLLQRGIVCPDGVTRKFGIDYNSDFDGVVISSDDYYEHADHDETDSRTGKPFGPYDYMEFGDDELDESAQWRDPKYKDKLYTQEKPDYNDTREYDRDMFDPKPKGYPGRKELPGGGEYNRTDPLVRGAGIGRSGIKNNILDRGKRKGLPSRDQITSLKQSIRDISGRHTRAKLPEQGMAEARGKDQDQFGGMHQDDFQEKLMRLKSLAGAGPMKTVYDPNKRVYKNMPTAVQPPRQPKK